MTNKNYYYHVAKSGSAWGVTPGTIFSVDRLVAGIPSYWLKLSESFLSKRKTLIINDQDAESRYSNQRTVAEERLKALQSDGFNIYIYKNSKFNVFDGDIPDNFKAMEPEALKQIAIQQLELIYDEILIINHQELEQLIAGDDDDWRYLPSFSQANLAKSNISISSLKNFLVEKGKYIELLNLSGCINLKGDLTENLELPKLTSLILGTDPSINDMSLRRNNLSVEVINRLIETASTTLEVINLNDLHQINKNTLSALVNIVGLKAIDLSSCSHVTGAVISALNSASLEVLILSKTNISGEALGILLSSALNIKTLKLSGCKNLKDLTAALQLVALKELDVSYSTIPGDALGKLLSASLNIETLNISDCTNLNDMTDASLETLQLAALNNLNVSSSSIPGNVLGKLLSKGSTIETLNLSYYHNFAGFTDELLETLQLAALKNLNVSSSSIPGTALGKLLSKASNIDTLDLSGCTNLNDMTAASLETLQLAALKNLNVSRSTIPGDALGKLLSKALNIENLNLSCCTNLNDMTAASLETLQLAALKKLHVYRSTISGDALGKLLSKALNINTLDLSGCKNLNDMTDTLPEDLQLAALKNLNVSNSTIPGNALGKLLSASLNIETLNISDYTNLNDMTDALPVTLQVAALKNLNVSKSQISGVVLGKWLSKALNIENLNVSDCKKLNDITNELPEKLELVALKNLNASNSTIPGDALGKLLSTSLNIETLNMSGCKNLNDMTDALPATLQLVALKNLNASNSTIPGDALGKLLSKALNIDTLDLSGCDNVAGFTDALPENMEMDALTCLKVASSNISSVTLGKLLLAALNVEILDLGDCENLEDLAEVLPEEVVLASLKELSVSPHIKSAGLYKLLSVTSENLYELYFCNNFFHDHDTVTEFINCYYKHIEIKTDHIDSYLDDIDGDSDDIDEDSNNNKVKPTTKQSLDADTAPRNTKFTVKKVFYPGNGAPDIKPSLYRLQVFNKCGLNPEPCLIDNAFFLDHDSPELELGPVDILKVDHDLYPYLAQLSQPLTTSRPHDLFAGRTEREQLHYYYGKHTLQLTQEWLALPSLSANETITTYHLSHETAVDIQYSYRDNLYYIRSKAGALPPRESISIEFIVQVPAWGAIISPTDANKDTLNEIRNLIKYLKKFESKPLHIENSLENGADYINAIWKQKVGACRHRSFAFKAYMAEKHEDIPVRIINNACHSFIEFQYNDQWYSCNLGGYPAELDIVEAHRPITCPQQSQPVTIELTSDGYVSSTPRISYFTVAKQEQPFVDAQHYIFSILSNNKQSTLIEADSPEKIAGLRYHLQKLCHSTSRPFFYIHSPQDLICSAPWIALNEDQTGVLKKGPGGPLHDFLQTHSNDNQRPLLIVNYEQFTASEIVKFNALLDTARSVDGTELPDNTRVIGLINPTKPGAYHGADFYSRFDYKDQCSLTHEQLEIPPIIQSRNHDNNTQRIEFYGSSAWKELLLGNWSLHGQELRFNEGELIRALKAGKTHLDLSNAPWDDPEFLCFWQTALLNRFIQVKNTTIPLPDNLILSQSQGYTFEQAPTIISLSTSSMPEHILNPGLITRLLGEYSCVNNGVYQKPGLIETHAGKSLALYVTHALSDAAWSRILNACQRHQVQLQLNLAHGIELPKAFNLGNCSGPSLCPRDDDSGRAVTNIDSKSVPEPEIKDWSPDIKNQDHTLYIHSTDIDATLTSIMTDETLVIDISEVDSADLITKITALFDETSLTFHFEEQTGALRNALQKNQNVILKGNFTKEMQYALSDVLYKRQSGSTPASSLILIGSEPDLFSFVPTFVHNVTLDDKKRALPEHITLDDELINSKNLAELNAICRCQNRTAHHEVDVTLPWKGMETLSLNPVSLQTDIDLSNAEEKTNAFNQHRINAIEQALSNSPFVFLAGMSGVGKTSFVKNIWKTKTGALHFGEDNIKAWANDRTHGTKTLFIDEANISSRQWSEFEGLFNKSPSILVGNEYIHLTPEHKVIFAGNPLSYGGERQLPSLFKRHGNSVVFDAMPPEFIYHTMLEPALSSLFEATPEEIALPILKIADYLTSCSKDKVLITPRELVAMALFTQCRCANQTENDSMPRAQMETDPYSAMDLDNFDHPDFNDLFSDMRANPIMEIDPYSGMDLEHSDFNDLFSDMQAHPITEHPVAQYYAYILSKSLVPDEFKNDFEIKFKVPEPRTRELPELKDFSCTKSNLPARKALDDFLSLRHRRQTEQGHPVQQYGGLGGLIIEGEPGIGKTELVVKTLVAHGLRKGNNNAGWALDQQQYHTAAVVGPRPNLQVFYTIPAGMMFEEKKNLLLKAFDEGSVVVMDEINSASMMEELLNSLLMGQTPDGKPPANPGFLLIGTQNPVTMSGRSRASTALQRRMQTVTLSNYNLDEMMTILQNEGLSENIAQNMIKEYLDIRHKAEQHSEPQTLCFRDVIKRAQTEFKAKRLLSKRKSEDIAVDNIEVISEQSSNRKKIKPNVDDAVIEQSKRKRDETPVDVKKEAPVDEVGVGKKQKTAPNRYNFYKQDTNAPQANFKKKKPSSKSGPTN